MIPIAQETFNAPDIDYGGISPIIALTAGMVLVLMVGLLRTPRFLVPGLTLAVLAATGGLAVWQWGEQADLVSGALRLDELGLAATLIAVFAAAVATILSIRESSAEAAGLGAFYALLLGSVLGMTILAMSQNLVAFFVGLELLSIPLYVMCGSAIRKEPSLESGLKYLIVGSLGSATLLYGFAFIYGAGASTDYNAIAEKLAGGEADNSIILIGTAMAAVGLAFKVSLAPFHQWTPDVYQGAPTPVTAFMAVATKAAAFIAFARLFEVALGPVVDDWQPALAALAVISIVVGNLGALGQDSLKRLLGYSGIAQAGYMLAGIVVATEIGLEALVFYLAAYTLMNLAVFVDHRRPRTRDRARRRHPRVRGNRPHPPMARMAADDRRPGAGRSACDLGFHRQALSDRGDRGRRLHVARRRDRDRHDGLHGLLPARAGGGLDEARTRPGRSRRRHARDGRRLARGHDRIEREGRRQLPPRGRRRGPLRGGDHLLRRHSLSPGGLGLGRGGVAQRHSSSVTPATTHRPKENGCSY